MGREIRKVPRGWEHPRDRNGRYRPMFNEYYIDELQKWIEGNRLWEKGKHPDQIDYPEATGDCKFYSEWHGNPPDIKRFNPFKWSEQEAVCYQLYENVTEGTPVSPVFDTLKELEDWLVKKQGYDRDAAKELCENGYSFTFTGYATNCQSEQHPLFPKTIDKKFRLQKGMRNGRHL